MHGCIRRSRWIAFLLWTLLAAACHHSLHHRPVEPRVPATMAEVFISGHVRSPGRQAFPADGRLTLGQAIAAAGGPAIDTAQLWIALRRGSSPWTHTTYLPGWMADRDLAADIPLASGDEIRVIGHQETNLAFDNAQLVGSIANGEPFYLGGSVARPGVRFIGQPTTTLATGPTRGSHNLGQGQPTTRLSDVLYHAGVGPDAQIMLLKRRTVSGASFDFFVFPLYDPRSVQLAMDSVLVAQDELSFGPLTLSPLLVSAFVEPLARGSVAAPAKSLDRVLPPFVEWKSGWMERLHVKGDNN
ncbi:MAG: hypothetical protein KatS3mg110_3091 [Pirellulaceae bacterium]|nr:MAG: hypothetical protein KatS3mg110_3091 [Pirellulaceae bacterium]